MRLLASGRKKISSKNIRGFLKTQALLFLNSMIRAWHDWSVGTSLKSKQKINSLFSSLKGITKKMEVTCTNANCNGLLAHADGSDFVYHSFFGSFNALVAREMCVMMRTINSYDDYPCTVQRPVVCQGLTNLWPFCFWLSLTSLKNYVNPTLYNNTIGGLSMTNKNSFKLPSQFFLLHRYPEVPQH